MEEGSEELRGRELDFLRGPLARSFYLAVDGGPDNFRRRGGVEVEDGDAAGNVGPALEGSPESPLDKDRLVGALARDDRGPLHGEGKVGVDSSPHVPHPLGHRGAARTLPSRLPHHVSLHVPLGQEGLEVRFFRVTEGPGALVEVRGGEEELVAAAVFLLRG